MGIVMWEKPKQVMSKEAWKGISADSAPPGVYCPNMSEEDMATWKGKIVGATLGHPQIELRKTFSAHLPDEKKPGWGGFGMSANVLVIVSPKGGIQYKHATRTNSKDYNVLISMNGIAMMSMAEYDEMKKAVDEAINKFIELETIERLNGGKTTKKGKK